MLLPDASIQFEPEQHIYTLRGMRLPSVTQIMEPMSLMLYKDVPLDVLQAAADRGTRAHEQISNYVLYGIMEEDTDTAPYIQAFLDFEKDYRPSWVASEYRTYHKIMRYAGTLDLLGYIQPDDDTGVDLIDLKCTSIFHPIMLSTQLSGYKEAVRSHGVKTRRQYGLQLLKNGKYRFEEIPDGYKTFLHCLAIYNAMAEERRA